MPNGTVEPIYPRHLGRCSAVLSFYSQTCSFSISVSVKILKTPVHAILDSGASPCSLQMVMMQESHALQEARNSSH